MIHSSASIVRKNDVSIAELKYFVACIADQYGIDNTTAAQFFRRGIQGMARMDKLPRKCATDRSSYHCQDVEKLVEEGEGAVEGENIVWL